HLGASRIDVVDLVSLRIVATIAGVSQVHGVRVAPDLGRLYASATGSNEVVTFDEDTLAPLGRAQAGGYPDGIAYVPTAGKVYVSNEVGGSETVLDARTGRLLGTVPVSGQAGNVAYDPGLGRLYVAGESGAVSVLEQRGQTLRELGRAKLASGAHTVAVDGETHRVFFPLPERHPVLRVMAPR